MKHLSTICEARRHAHYLADRSHARVTPEEKDLLIQQLLEVIDRMWNMGQRMEIRLKEYYDFMTEWLEAADQLMED